MGAQHLKTLPIACVLGGLGSSLVHSAECRCCLAVLQNNGWVWELAGVRVLVDPWLVGELDFDIPAFYSAKKRVTGNMTVSSAVPCPQERARMHSHHRSFSVYCRASGGRLVFATLNQVTRYRLLMCAYYCAGASRSILHRPTPAPVSR
jgi:hypothetical protein